MSFEQAEQTRFQDLRLVANGGAIVDGTMRIVTSGALAAALAPPADAVIVADFTRSHLRGTLSLLQPLTRQADGWHDWRPPILSIWIEPAFPDLTQLRSYDRAPMRFSASLQGGRLLSVHQRYPAHKADPYPTLFANVAAVEGVLTPLPAGLRLELDGPITPTAGDEQVPALTDARIECDVLLPWTYLHSVGSKLAFVTMSSASDEKTPWRPSGVGAQRLALGGSLAFFEGRLELPGQRADHYPDGPFVSARMNENETMLHGAGNLTMKSDGFVWPSGGSGGPELVLEFGHALFARMLGRERSATMELCGPGIGHVDGQTGWVMEAGGPCTQPMIACRIHLERTDDGIRFELAGELAPLEPGHWAKSLGPRFEASVFVPTDFLMLRQWKIENLVQEWRNRHGISFG